MICLWSSKGGAGCSVSAAALALLACERGEVLLVDLAGEQGAVLGVADAGGPTLSDWLAATGAPPPDALARLERPVAPGLHLVAVDPRTEPDPAPGRALLLAELLAAERRTVVVDLGLWSARWTPVVERAGRRILVTRLCYLALRRASTGPSPSGVVVVAEPGRALGPSDVTAVVDAPVVAVVPVDPAVARLVDAGLLATRPPRPLRRLSVLLAEEARP